MTAPLRFLTLACTRAHLCRRLLFHSQFIAPNAYSLSFPSSSSSDKSITRRPFVSAQPHRASPAPTPSTTPAVLRHSPTIEDIEAAKLDVELPPQRDVQLVLTERAAEVRCNCFCIAWCDRLLTRSSYAATLSNIFSRKTCGFGPANLRRIGWLPRISI
jgi:hypothetical protein